MPTESHLPVDHGRWCELLAKVTAFVNSRVVGYSNSGKSRRKVCFCVGKRKSEIVKENKNVNYFSMHMCWQQLVLDAWCRIFLLSFFLGHLPLMTFLLSLEMMPAARWIRRLYILPFKRCGQVDMDVVVVTEKLSQTQVLLQTRKQRKNAAEDKRSSRLVGAFPCTPFSPSTLSRSFRRNLSSSLRFSYDPTCRQFSSS